jgi:hypothetical protein
MTARVGQGTGAAATEGANPVQASLRAVGGAADQPVLDRIRDQLPSDLARMLQRTGEGDTSALRTGA